MNRNYFLFFVTMFFMASSAWASCSSDFSCGTGSKCVKPPFQSSGTCMKSVDEYGVQKFDSPKTDSIGPNTNASGQCSFNVDCPIGFRCDSQYKACVKR